MESALQLKKQAGLNPAMLNMASRSNPCGGYRNGTGAQEGMQFQIACGRRWQERSPAEPHQKISPDARTFFSVWKTHTGKLTFTSCPSPQTAPVICVPTLLRVVPDRQWSYPLPEFGGLYSPRVTFFRRYSPIWPFPPIRPVGDSRGLNIVSYCVEVKATDTPSWTSLIMYP